VSGDVGKVAKQTDVNSYWVLTATTPTWQAFTTDVTIDTSDITTNNSSTSKHGFLKKLSNVATDYMDGTGNWSTPAGGGGGGGSTDVLMVQVFS
jgi:hypothetical protein